MDDPSAIALSVVVASKDARRTIRQCLESLISQKAGKSVEVLVIDASTDGSAEIARQFEGVTVVQADPNSLIPELWGQGLQLSCGKAVAFTTAHFIPARNWITELDALLQQNYAAVGGAFDKKAPDRLSQWGIYYLRYAPYLPPFTPHTADQLAADNAAYQRWVFEKYPDLIKDGFWEHPVNRQLRADGQTLYLTSNVRVEMGYFSSPREFFRQRFLHGRKFGSGRAAEANTTRRIALVIASPLIPFILLYRVTRQVLAKKAQPGKFFVSLPWILYYILGWSFGELSGYLTGNAAEKKQGGIGEMRAVR